MALFALGDLHLSLSSHKPMDMFGPNWADHASRIQAAWIDQVGPDDVVLVPGDISWAMTLEEAQADLAFIGQLPGRKVMIRGNHDYWWHSIGRVRSQLHPSVLALQNDAVELAGVAICGTRGWLLPSHPKFVDEDLKIYRREVERLHMSLRTAATFGLPMLAMLHYPPAGALDEATAFTDLLSQYGVSWCVYGHLHGSAHRYRVEGEKDGVRYALVSADFVDFTPVAISP